MSGIPFLHFPMCQSQESTLCSCEPHLFFFILFLFCFAAHFQWWHCTLCILWRTKVAYHGKWHSERCVLCWVSMRVFHSRSKSGSLEGKSAGPSVLCFYHFLCNTGILYYADTVATNWSALHAYLLAMPKPDEAPLNRCSLTFVCPCTRKQHSPHLLCIFIRIASLYVIMYQHYLSNAFRRLYWCHDHCKNILVTFWHLFLGR